MEQLYVVEYRDFTGNKVKKIVKIVSQGDSFYIFRNAESNKLASVSKRRIIDLRKCGIVENINSTELV